MINKKLFNSALARAGMTQYELAKKLNMSKNTMNSKVNGKSYFTTEQIIKICEICEIVNTQEKCDIFLPSESQ